MYRKLKNLTLMKNGRGLLVISEALSSKAYISPTRTKDMN